MNVRLASEQRPLRAGRGVNGDIPILVHRPMRVLPEHETIGAGPRRSVIVNIGVGRGIEIEIRVGLAADDLQRRAPRAIRGVKRGDLEIIIAARCAQVREDLGAKIGGSKIPDQGVKPAEFRGEGVAAIRRRAGQQIHADEISVRGGERAVEY